MNSKKGSFINVSFARSRSTNSRGEKSTRLDRLLTEKTLEYVKRVALLAQEYNMTSAQLALGWVLSNPQVTSIVLGNRDDQQLSSSLDFFKKDYPKEINNKIRKLTEDFHLSAEFNSRPNPFLET